MIDVQTLKTGGSYTLEVPASKSITNRVLLIAALCDGVSEITNPLMSDDTRVMLSALESLGIVIERSNSSVIIHGNGGILRTPKEPMYLQNAGTAVRFLTVASLLADGPVSLTGNERMKERPLNDLIIALRNHGVHIECHEKEGYVPITISGAYSGGTISISGKMSSQYISALLQIAPYSTHPTTITISDELVSKPYIDLTLSIMNDFGVHVTHNNYQKFEIPQQKYQAKNYEIEADASSASYFYGIAAINQSTVTVSNANPHSVQGDTAILEVLEKMGCTVSQSKNALGITVSGPKKLKALGEINLNHMPDSAMTVAVIATCAEGTTIIRGVENMRIKETDRIAALVTEIRKTGIKAEERADGMIIHGDPQLITGAQITTYDDHRMAMCFALLGTRVADMHIEDPDCVNKTYPQFWNDLQKIYE